MRREALLSELRAVWALAAAMAFERGYRVGDDRRWFAFYKRTYRDALDYDMSFALNDTGDSVEVLLSPSPVAVLAPSGRRYSRARARRDAFPLVRPHRGEVESLPGGWLVIYQEGSIAERALWAPSLGIGCEAGRHSFSDPDRMPREVRYLPWSMHGRL